MLPTILGFLIIIVLLVLIMKEKAAAPVIFATVPVIAALILGYGLKDITGWFQAGFQSTANNAALAIFGILYFAMMNDIGMFDDIVGFITKKFANSVTLVFIACWLVAVISTLDGASPSTILVTAPTMIPIFQKMKIRPVNCAFIITIVVGIFQYLPYTGMMMAVASAMSTDVGALWMQMIPAFIFGLALSFVLVFFMSKQEAKRIAAGKNDYLVANAEAGEVKAAQYSDWHLKMRPINLILTAILMICLLTNTVRAQVAFGVALPIALILNYTSSRGQAGVIKKHAHVAMFVAVTFLMSGVYSQIMSGTGMMDSMVSALLNVLPESVGSHISIIFGALALPLGFVLGPDAFYFGVMPAVGGVAASYGISTAAFCATILIGKGIGMLFSPTTPNLYLMTDMCKVDVKEYFKFTAIPLFLFSLVVLLAACILGVATV